MKQIEISPIKETSEDYEALEEKMRILWRQWLYIPLLKELGLAGSTLKNAKADLYEAIRTGRITFYRGEFSGRFNATISKELERIGAKWDRKTGTFKIPQSSLPVEVRDAVQSSEARFKAKIAGVDKKLAQILPEEIADKLQVEKVFDTSLWKIDQAFKSTVKGIAIAPNLSPEQRTKIAKEWQNNMRLWVQNWTAEEIVKLRKQMQETVFAGNRYESMVKTIQKSYGQSLNKAKFLARQETGLLMAKFKETRYQDAGIMEYKWRCVAGSKNHPVRPWHKALEGKTFRWDDPPITTKPGTPVRRNNPGQDFNCRCFAVPIVKA